MSIETEAGHDTVRLDLRRPRIWRTGRKVKRTIYIQAGKEPGECGEDQLIGMMDSPELATLVVDSVNHFYSIDPDHPCPAVVAVNNHYGRDVIPEDHGPVLAAPTETHLPVIPLDPLGDDTSAGHA